LAWLKLPIIYPSLNLIVMTAYNSSVAIQQQVNSPMTLISQKAARLSFITAIISLVLIAALHFIKKDMEPSWHMVSEYAIGDHGWVMKLAFFSWGISCITLASAVRYQIKTLSGRIGLVLLFIVGISIVMAGVFVMDPPTASKDEMTTHGNLHGLTSMIGIPGHAIAAVLISFSLSRNPAWASAKSSLKWSAHFTWISLVVMIGSIFIMLGKTQGKFDPEALIGWPNRILVFAYCSWLIVVANNAIRLSRQDTN
jgi:hypothetical protein